MKMRFAALLVCALFLLLPAHAAEPIDPAQSSSLTIHYHDGEQALGGARFSAYYVATVDEAGVLTATEDFAAFARDLADGNARRTLPSALQSHVLREGVLPTASGTTDAQGTLTFSGLLPGLYLVTGRRLYTGGSCYDVTPFLVQLPMENGGGWSYDVTVDPKNASQPTPSEGSTVTRRVLKVWDDEGFEEQRPPEIVVQLVREDGEIFDTVTLNGENGWSYRWESLDAQYRWFITEQTPSGYRMELTQEGVTFVLTNHYVSDEPDEPDKPDEPGTPDQPGEPDQPVLPQTGQLWWPVPLLMTAGLLLCCVGLACRKQNDA